MAEKSNGRKLLESATIGAFSLGAVWLGVTAVSDIDRLVEQAGEKEVPVFHQMYLPMIPTLNDATLKELNESTIIQSRDFAVCVGEQMRSMPTNLENGIIRAQPPEKALDEAALLNCFKERASSNWVNENPNAPLAGGLFVCGAIGAFLAGVSSIGTGLSMVRKGRSKIEDGPSPASA